ncbi:major facilitator superfamily domain-containing protein [Aspergillus similis]
MSDLSKKPRSSILGLFKEVFNWYPSSYPAEERKLLFKLDLSILVYSCLCFFVKYLDQTNISNAYVSGLKEDFRLYGNELNYFNVCYYTAYVVFQVPGLLLLSRPKLRATNVHQLYALRFLVGMFEAPVFAGTHFILGSWYSGSDLFKRAGTWFICNPLGQMVSGYLQAAAYTNLSGVGGMQDGALIGFFIFPGVPDSPAPFFLTKRDIEIAKDRLSRAKIRRSGRLGLDVFKRSAKRWHIYVFLFCYACMILSSYPSSYMNLWLKDEGYSVTKINQYPTVVQAITIVSSWLGTTLASIYPSWIIYTIISTFSLFSTLCMCIWYIPTGLKFFAWFLFGANGCASPILYSTVNTIVKDDSEERALIMGSMMTFGYSFNIWVPLLLFPTAGPDGAPRWRKGWPVTFVFYFFLWAGFITALVLHRRDQKRKELAGERESEDGSTGIETPVETEVVVQNTKDGEEALRNVK